MVWLSTLGETPNPGLAQGKSFRGFDPPGTVVSEKVPKYGWGGVGFE